jgi:carbonic anhydrase
MLMTPKGLDALVDASVKAQVTNAAASAAVKSAWGKGLKVYVHGWVYHIENGTLRDLKVTIAPPL